MSQNRETRPVYVDETPGSPFEDTFEFEEGTSKGKPSRGGSILKKFGSLRRNNKKNGEDANEDSGVRVTFDEHDDEDASQYLHTPLKHSGAEDMKPGMDDDVHSFDATPKMAEPSATFEDVALDGVDQDKMASETHHEMKRLRMGTRRNKKGTANVGRAKTLRWAKKNFHNPFEDPKKDGPVDETGMQNRVGQLRTVYFNMPLPQNMLDEEGKPNVVYPRNKIRTTKYTPLTFFPKNIMLQFQNFANVYFLVLIILGAFSIFGVTNPGLNAVPLIVIVIITAIKDAFEDSRRTVLDLEVNNTRTYILKGIENPNVSNDSVSPWRRFKKANTKLLFRFITFCRGHMTEEGKRERLQAKRAKLHGTRMSSDKPRNSLDSIDSYRVSADYGRYSQDFDNLGRVVSRTDDVNVIDRALPANSESRFMKDYWKNVRVGDVIRIHNNDEVPADIILLSTSDVDGACYVETKNLDGETNLKVRQSLKCSHKIRNSRDVTRSRFWVESEGPHANLYSYQGNLKWMDSKSDELRNEPITINNMLLRGFTLRNTKWAMGLVIFTGEDTKTMINSGITPTKKSRISRELNFSVLINFLLLFILCFISGVANGVNYDKRNQSRNSFEFGTVAGRPATNGFVSFLVAVILYQSLVPISLYISVEIIKTAQAAFIYGDVLLYNARLDYPCTPKSWNISDDLGQIEYIFSDKTGTLTQNVMEFKKATINGVSYGRAYTEALAGLRKRQGVDTEVEGRREKEEIARDKDTMINELRALSSNSQFNPDDLTFISKEFVRDLQGASGEYQQRCCEHFMLALSLCHSVLVEPSKHDPNKLDLKAQSPDEAALVGTARDVGFSFVGKTKTGLLVEIQGVTKEFRILNILEFNSSRKRMSCIVQIPPTNPGDDPRALLICKGADSVIYSRLKRSGDANNETLLEKTALHLEQYATEGLRTLCLAQRELSWPEYVEWNKKYDVAAAALTNREEQLDEVSDSIERELVLLGGTAIEDRLQDGVPDSISLLAEAGIKLWVLTGDKVETAINIGFSCNLLNNEMELLIVKQAGDDVDEFGSDPFEIVNTLITKYLTEKFSMSGSELELSEAKRQHGLPKGEFGVIIDGDALKMALSNDDIRRKFLLLCKNCKAVLCCRVSPSQKAAVVKLVKEWLSVMTLAIGDGSNDVAMIQSADVGVGIAGEEGRQAVMCSDYAIGQFRYLTRLILVHGRWSYKRLAEMIPEFFYKNVIFTLALFWYGIYNDFDGSYLYEYTYMMFYNLAFTSLPVIFLGILDQDVSDTVSLIVPQLYRVGILRTEWNQTKFLWYMFDGLYQSIICFFFPYLIYHKTMIASNNGLGLEHRYYVGVMVTTIAVISCNCYVLLHQYKWDWFTVMFIAISCLVVFVWTGIWTSSITSGEFWKAGARVYGAPSFWAVFFVGTLFCLLPRFTWDCYNKMFNPKDVDIVREMWSRGDFDHYPQGYDPTDPNRPNISKGGRFGDNVISLGALTNGVGDNYSRDTVMTEEIPMRMMDFEDGSPRQFVKEEAWKASPRENQDLLYSPLLQQQQQQQQQQQEQQQQLHQQQQLQQQQTQQQQLEHLQKLERLEQLAKEEQEQQRKLSEMTAETSASVYGIPRASYDPTRSSYETPRASYHTSRMSYDRTRPSTDRPRHSLAETRTRASLERTRSHMLANNQLDYRYSTDRARTSLDLPGVTHAVDLMNRGKKP
ncbi:BN860_11738g1_1 [Zygosaccharomyces bailii CLIB 213]|uniref:Phospholipid-transporting ATPase n=1 Tax=Zygosaccharomyces bailii (strain CLIB 213 / ATCC 58445 / CBS 680 / BCRC 21525 / NBRC 1098 / NCYC 1416 / NRRL Y-2227) TaxID=1333698 RepID=A0A8J2T4T3_ZYGB2|nr:BN860_11738g1_1 [Zygosaccharomyces bailii CLIB 213]